MKRNERVLAAVLLALVIAALGVPWMANAAGPAAPGAGVPRAPAVVVTYTVNTSSDSVYTIGCTGAIGLCSLRGAVQLANNSADSPLILFSPTLWGVTITLGSSLQITGGNTAIDGSAISSDFIIIEGPASPAAFEIRSDRNRLKNLAIVKSGVLVYGDMNDLLFLHLFGYSGDGVLIQSTATTTTLTSNVIGPTSLQGAGGCPVPAPANGIFIYGNHSVLNSNTIGCNQLWGVGISSSDFNEFRGNRIGVTSQGIPVPNGVAGLAMLGNASNNLVGFADSAPNVISGNLGDGIRISDPGTTANRVRNNLIGLHPNGLSAVPNGGNGIAIKSAADSTVVGGSALTESNRIAGNAGAGILIEGVGNFGPSDTRYNLVVGNHIGLNGPLTATVANTGTGIVLRNGAWANAIGSANPSMYNTIMGNHGDGIALLDVRANTLDSNLVGVNAAYTYFYGNDGNGVRLDQGAHGNTVARHSILYAGGAGILLSGTKTATNTLLNDNAYQSGYFFGAGVEVRAGAHDNDVIGGSYNGNGYGVSLDGVGTTGNLITGTELVQNYFAGIEERNGAAANEWRRLVTYDNTGLGVEKSPAGPSGPFPVITSMARQGATVTLTGTASLAVLQSVHVDVYRVDLDPSGYGEGDLYIGTAQADVNGVWSLSFPGTGCYTAIQTVVALFTGSRTSSEFGPSSCRTFLPVIVR